MHLMSPGHETGDFVGSFLQNAKERLTQDDFLAVPFDMNSEQDKAVFEALTHNKEGFQAWRENMARTTMHMELSDYSTLYEHHRSSLLDLAANMDIPVELHKTSFDALLRKVDAEVSVRERRSPKGAAAFVEARVAVAALHQHAHLFQSRTTLQSLLLTDAITYGIGSQIGEAFDWVVSKVKQYKCTWCKNVVIHIQKKACAMFGKAVCTLLVSAMSGPLGAIASKFFCGFPLFLNSLFSGWCNQGVAYLQRILRITPDCICSFTIPTFTIPATDFKVAGVSVYKNTKREIAIGQVCTVAAGQCAGSSDADKKAYDTKKAADDAARAKKAAEEAERVKKMTKAEKIAYHTKIIKGEIKSNLSQRLVTELLDSVTGLSKSLGKSALAGAKALATDGVKGAVTAAAKSLAESTVKGAAKAVGKQVQAAAATTAKAVTKAAIGAVGTVAANRLGNAVQPTLNKAASAVANTASKAINATGTAIVKGQTAVISTVKGKAAGAAYNTKATAAVKKVTNAVNKTVDTVGKFAGESTVTLGKGIINGGLATKVGGPAGGYVADKINGKF